MIFGPKVGVTVSLSVIDTLLVRISSKLKMPLTICVMRMLVAGIITGITGVEDVMPQPPGVTLDV